MKLSVLLIIGILLGLATVAVVARALIHPPFDTTLGGFISTLWAGYWAAYSNRPKKGEDGDK